MGCNSQSDYIITSYKEGIIMKLMKRLWKEEEGQGLTEYALVLAMIVIVVTAVLLIFKPKLGNLINGIELKVQE